MYTKKGCHNKLDQKEYMVFVQYCQSLLKYWTSITKQKDNQQQTHINKEYAHHQVRIKGDRRSDKNKYKICVHTQWHRHIMQEMKRTLCHCQLGRADPSHHLNSNSKHTCSIVLTVNDSPQPHHVAELTFLQHFKMT